MSIKAGVQLHSLKPQMVLAYVIVDRIFHDVCNSYAHITSGEDSLNEHMEGSLHGQGYALDFRVHHVHESWRERLLIHIRRELGSDFDVVHEYIGEPREHFHVEYDPQ